MLRDLPVVVTRIKHVGKEGNELEEHRAGLVSEAERQLEYNDSWFEDLVAALRSISTQAIAQATGYDRRTVRRLKRGEFRPSAKPLQTLLSIARGP